MALNNSGPISLGGSVTGESVAVELGQSATGTISLNDTNVRSLAAVPSGTIIMPTNFYGKSLAFVFNETISSDTSNYHLKNAAIAAGWNQTTPLVATVTINSGVTLRSTSTSTGAFRTGFSFPAYSTIAIINNGLIVGQGGAGGQGGRGTNTSPAGNGYTGGAGGPAMELGWNITLTNNNIIAGGGGGGGGGGGANYPFDSITWQFVGGSGGGGGAGFGAGGAGGVPDSWGAAKATGNVGSAGTATSGGAGGPTTIPGGNWFARGGAGGNGGGWGAAGSSGSPPPPYFTTVPSSGGAGGAAGAAIIRNSVTITYLATGQIYGAIT